MRDSGLTGVLCRPRHGYVLRNFSAPCTWVEAMESCAGLGWDAMEVDHNDEYKILLHFMTRFNVSIPLPMLRNTTGGPRVPQPEPHCFRPLGLRTNLSGGTAPSILESTCCNYTYMLGWNSTTGSFSNRVTVIAFSGTCSCSPSRMTSLVCSQRVSAPQTRASASIQIHNRVVGGLRLFPHVLTVTASRRST